MSIFSISRPLLAGILHSFDPDHVTAVSVLAAENAANKKNMSWAVMFKASQWALGHSVTLLIFGAIALLFKSSLHFFVEDISLWAQLAVGPIMILLGLQAIKRNYKVNVMIASHKKKEDHKHLKTHPVHLHNKAGEQITVNPLSRSFWVGMLHGLAGTGGVLTSALIISASTFGESMMILVIESVGIIMTMGIYSYVLISAMGRFFEKNMMIFKCINGLAGLSSVAIGSYLIFTSFS